MTEKLTFTGIVQGIGFRPTALRLAARSGLKGQVKNSGGSVEIIINGSKEALDDFVRRLIGLFEIKYYKREPAPDRDFDGFKIAASDFDRQTPFITPDLAVCPDCERELADSADRRFMHPFISCVNCGPRYTIISRLPYDRENTAMSSFAMCESCAKEYANSNDRRCHAQTIACRQCGPKLNMSIDSAVHIIKNGGILAVKDTGGYHLACRADLPEAAKKIREFKGREAKPFAVMFKSIDEIHRYCRVNEQQKKLLLSPARPIVLLKKIKDFDPSVCGKSEYTGAFLPCSPVQILLLNKISPLVMTSANISGEPIITSNDEIKKLGVPVLSHDRDILTPVDDSVISVINNKASFIRRARGYVPLAIDIGISAPCDTFAAGGDLKAVFGFHRGRYVFLSQHFGDLESRAAFDCYRENIDSFAALHGFHAEKTACDMHPGYYSAGVYKNSIKIQHHYAHIASVIAEHHLSGEVLGFAFDGTGYGSDGAVWGGEVIYFDGSGFSRPEHLKYTKMPASDEISKNAELALECYLGTNELLNSAIKAGVNTVNSSSMGRLFDAASALLGVCGRNTYEGECAQKLEALAATADKAYMLTPAADPAQLLCEMQSALKTVPPCEIALGFHLTICEIIKNTALKYGVSRIALSGGVFNNKILTENTIQLLEKNGFSVYTNEKVPCGDGGIALGQLYIAALEGI